MNKKTGKKWIAIIITIILFVIINIAITYLSKKQYCNSQPNSHYIRESSIPTDTPKP